MKHWRFLIKSLKHLMVKNLLTIGQSQMFCQYKLGLTNKFKNKFSQVMKDISTNPDPESEDYQSAKCDGTIANKSDVILYKIGNFLCNAYSLEQGKLFEMHLDTVIKTQSEKRVINKLPANFANRYKSYHNAWNINRWMISSCNDLNFRL
jgi:hypothetical protein